MAGATTEPTPPPTENPDVALTVHGPPVSADPHELASDRPNASAATAPAGGGGGGSDADAVVNDHVLSWASALPAASLTPLDPPTIVAVYVVPAARSADGFSVTCLAVAS